MGRKNPAQDAEAARYARPAYPEFRDSWEAAVTLVLLNTLTPECPEP